MPVSRWSLGVAAPVTVSLHTARRDYLICRLHFQLGSRRRYGRRIIVSDAIAALHETRRRFANGTTALRGEFSSVSSDVAQSFHVEDVIIIISMRRRKLISAKNHVPVNASVKWYRGLLMWAKCGGVFFRSSEFDFAAEMLTSVCLAYTTDLSLSLTLRLFLSECPIQRCDVHY